MKPTGLFCHPSATKRCPLKLRPKPCITYRCPHWLINIEDLIYPNVSHLKIVETNADLQQSCLKQISPIGSGTRRRPNAPCKARILSGRIQPHLVVILNAMQKGHTDLQFAQVNSRSIRWNWMLSLYWNKGEGRRLI